MRKIVGILAMAALIVSCGGNRHQMSPEELAQKLDSIKALEIKEKLKLQGIDLESSDNPFKVFFDSLNMQTLPLTYSEDYVRFLPGYQEIPTEILSYMELQGGEHPKAVSLPESVGARLMILAVDEKELSVKEIMDSLGLKDRKNVLNLYLNPAIDEGFVRMLYPQSPRHPRQKYLLTVKGMALFKELTKKE